MVLKISIFSIYISNFVTKLDMDLIEVAKPLVIQIVSKHNCSLIHQGQKRSYMWKYLNKEANIVNQYLVIIYIMLAL
jgi:hypothetical protein